MTGIFFKITWLVIILAAIFLEALTERLVTVWCAPAAAASLVSGFFGASFAVQTAIFGVSSAVMIALAQIVRAVIKRWRRS